LGFFFALTCLPWRSAATTLSYAISSIRNCCGTALTTAP
jgi:hypothetical protein